MPAINKFSYKFLWLLKQLLKQNINVNKICAYVQGKSLENY